jgi:pimeloyl-ACP methyl ester carboxylesterase
VIEVPGRSLWVEEHGAGRPSLVLLHGMTGTGRVWDAVVDRLRGRWPGRVVVPDLSGHGRSPHRGPYSLGSMAADVAGVLGRDDDVVVVGHSLGGAVGLALASGWFGCGVTTVLALSVKVRWSDEDLARASAVAAKAAAKFPTEGEAVERYLRVSGLGGLVDATSAVARAGVVAEGGGYRLAHDPAVSDLGRPDIAGLLAACRANVVFGTGSEDAMATHATLAELDPSARRFDGLGHNLHVEAPDVVAELILSTNELVVR